MNITRIPTPEELRGQAKRLETLAQVVEVVGGADLLLDLVRSISQEAAGQILLDNAATVAPAPVPATVRHMAPSKSVGENRGKSRSGTRIVYNGIRGDILRFLHGKDTFGSLAVLRRFEERIPYRVIASSFKSMYKDGYMERIREESDLYRLSPKGKAEAAWYAANPDALKHMDRAIQEDPQKPEEAAK